MEEQKQTHFESLFGKPPQTATTGHARVNLIGEHTDYNGGYVLPLLIPHHTSIELAARDDRAVRLWSDKKAKNGIIEYTLGEESAGRGWIDYIQGITWVLRAERHSLTGFEARILSDVPIGSGISSSAALEIAALRALRNVFRLTLNDVEIAAVGQRAENMFVGARTGIMDQMAASIGSTDAALFIDTTSLQHKLVPLPSDFELAVIHSGIAHINREGGYNIRREECEKACFLLGVRSLRELNITHLPILSRLPEPLSRRVRHVITENERVLQALESMEENDMERLGRLFYASHWSMRDDYEVSLPQIDFLVELCRAEDSVFGARMTGGGFGGSVIVLTRPGQSKSLAQKVSTTYLQHTKQKPTVLVP